MNKNKETLAKKIRSRLSKIKYVENISEIKPKPFNVKQFVKEAREVRKTFSDEDLKGFGYSCRFK